MKRKAWIRSVSRLAGLGAIIVGSIAPAHAAFDLKGEALTAFANQPVAVSRESLEERSSSPVANGVVRDGRLNLSVNAGPGLFSVKVGDASATFVAADGQTLQLTAAADGKTPQVKGGRDQELFLAYDAFRVESLARKVTPVRAAIAASLAKADEAEAERLTAREVAAYAEHRRELNDFTLAQLRGSAALYAASLRWDGDYRLPELAAAVADFSRQYPGAEIGRLMDERIARFRATAIGAAAPALVGSTPNGMSIELSDFRGRYVLVDFWASWCGPCRVENRNYANLYPRYQAAGFEILAVSVDEDEVAWKAAIAKDNARWPQMSDLKGLASPLTARYSVSALPASFLLDREGRIIARDLRGKDLSDRLASLFPSPGTR